MTDYGVTVKKIILRRAMKWLSERSLPLRLALTDRKEHADSNKETIFSFEILRYDDAKCDQSIVFYLYFKLYAFYDCKKDVCLLKLVPTLLDFSVALAPLKKSSVQIPSIQLISNF